MSWWPPTGISYRDLERGLRKRDFRRRRQGQTAHSVWAHPDGRWVIVNTKARGRDVDACVLNTVRALLADGASRA